MPQENPYQTPDSERNSKNENNQDGEIILPSSPWTLAGLKLLFFKPEHFFSSKEWLMKQPYLFFTIYLSGLAGIIDRIDNQLIKYDLNGKTSSFIDSLVSSWSYYWMYVLAMGLICSLFVWAIGGWWYSVRLKWSGDKEVDSKQARTAYIYQDMVTSIPTIITSLGLVAFFDNYIEYWRTDESYSMLILIFIFWSCYVSYKAALSFEVEIYKARIWFLILPCIFYAFAVGVVIALVKHFS